MLIPPLLKNQPPRSKSSFGTSFLHRRFTGLTLTPRGSDAESSDEIRGPLGLNLLYEPSEPLIDFVFVHGLRGGSRKTWSKTENLAHFWPQQWLPMEPSFKHVRIHSFGYSTDWGERKASPLTIHDFGQALLGDLQNSPTLNRESHDSIIVLIGHSMGGVVIKKVLLLAKQDPFYHNLAARIHSIFFLATPHRGADSAQLLSNLLRLTPTHGPKPYVDSLIPNSEAIQVINDEFRHVYQGTQLWSFFETVKSSLGLIVEKDSAVLGLPGERVQLLNADHRHVCKFEDPTDNNYCTLRNAFVSTIKSIEKTCFSVRNNEQQIEMRLLSPYLGLVETPSTDLANILDQQTEGSCCWLTDKSSFHEWQEGYCSSPKYFWVSGEPATGKSTLAGHVIKYLKECNSDCSYFFFRHGVVGKSSIAELLCSLAWQMASTNSEIRRKLLDMQKEGASVDKDDERSVWRTIFIARIFRTELRQPHYWVIDGLDECTHYSALFPLMSKIEKQFPLRVFVTSRPSLAIERSFSQEKISKVVEVMALKTSLEDIRLFIKAHAQYLPVENDVDRQDLIQQLLQKSNGNFLWTSLVVKELEETISEQQVHEVLESVPKEIDDLYTRILTNISATPKTAELCKTVLRWAACAARPLSVEELREALRLDIGEIVPQLEKTAGSICGNLVYVDNTARVQLAHHTLREYLFRRDQQSQFSIFRPKEHARIAEICLKYLCSDEMKTPRYRRAGNSVRQRKRSAFAEYSTTYFSEHFVRTSSAEDAQLAALNSFLQSNTLTWIEVVATSGDLYPITQTAKQLKTYLDRRMKYRSPLGIEVPNVSEWVNDLIHLVAKFGRTLLKTPSAIHFLVPPVCPPESMISKSFKSNPRGLQLVGLSQRHWDDRLCCITFSQAQALSVACRESKFAIGLSDGFVHVYHETTFQEELKLNHGEPVRRLAFSTINIYMASAGRRKISLWNISTGILLWATKVLDQPLALDFDEDDTVLMAATKANSMGFWDVITGRELEVSQFSDIDENEQTEYHYQRPPIHAAFSPGLKLLGIAYRQRPVSFWDLEDKTFIGQFHKSRAVYPEPLIHAFIFNPKPEINLAAVAYQDGDVVVFNPWTQQIDAVSDAGASVLAASPDGSILATGGGDGVLKLYDFETLKMLYQINSLQQDIRAIVFNSSSLRFLNAQGNHCDIWEPSVLVRRINLEDDSSIDLSEIATEGPQNTTVGLFDDDLAITAIAAHHEGEYIFCGRENGSVEVYSTKTGRSVQDLFSHDKNIAIISLEWNERENILASIDQSGVGILRKIVGSTPGPFCLTDPLIHHKSSGVIHQVLLSPDGKRVLISTAETDQLWNIDNASLIHKHVILEPRSSLKWASHPNYNDRLLLVVNGRAKLFDWAMFTELSKPSGIDLGLSEASRMLIADLGSSVQGRNVFISFSGTRMDGLPPALRLWPSRLFLPEAEHLEGTAYYDDLAKDIKSIIGVYKSLLLFLDHDGWVCSLSIDDIKKDQVYNKHFFVPLQWHSTVRNMPMLVTRRGHVVMGIKNEIAVFHHGLDFEERVSLGGALVSAKPSMTSILKRGISSPI